MYLVAIARVVTILVIALGVATVALHAGTTAGFEQHVAEVVRQLPTDLIIAVVPGGYTFADWERLRSALRPVADVAVEGPVFVLAAARTVRGQDPEGRVQGDVDGKAVVIQPVSAEYFRVRDVPLAAGHVFTDAGPSEPVPVVAGAALVERDAVLPVRVDLPGLPGAQVIGRLAPYGTASIIFGDRAVTAGVDHTYFVPLWTSHRLAEVWPSLCRGRACAMGAADQFSLWLRPEPGRAVEALERLREESDALRPGIPVRVISLSTAQTHVQRFAEGGGRLFGALLVGVAACMAALVVAMVWVQAYDEAPRLGLRRALGVTRRRALVGFAMQVAGSVLAGGVLGLALAALLLDGPVAPGSLAWRPAAAFLLGSLLVVPVVAYGTAGRLAAAPPAALVRKAFVPLGSRGVDVREVLVAGALALGLATWLGSAAAYQGFARWSERYVAALGLDVVSLEPFPGVASGPELVRELARDERLGGAVVAWYHAQSVRLGGELLYLALSTPELPRLFGWAPEPWRASGGGREPDAWLGAEAAKTLFPGTDPRGRFLTLPSGEQVRVAGVLPPLPAVLPDLVPDRAVFVLANTLPPDSAYAQSLSVGRVLAGPGAAGGAGGPALRQALEAVLRDRYGQVPGLLSEPGRDMVRIRELQRRFQEAVDLLLVLLLVAVGAAFTVISAWRALGEVRWFALRHALGATRRRVAWEYALRRLGWVAGAAAVGALVGLATGAGAALRHRWPPALPEGEALALPCLILVLTAVGSGLVPARLALGRAPVRRLRWE